jgi:hypothetical protein
VAWPWRVARVTGASVAVGLSPARSATRRTVLAPATCTVSPLWPSVRPCLTRRAVTLRSMSLARSLACALAAFLVIAPLATFLARSRCVARAAERASERASALTAWPPTEDRPKVM